jgi:hypothetical protein
MSFSKVFFHVAANCAGCNGIESHWQALDAAGVPFAVYSANDAGLITAAAKHPRAALVYRDVEASTVNPADYATDPEEAAAVYWQRGTPEPEHWLEPGWELYLRLCAAHPAQVAISLHEYAL